MTDEPIDPIDLTIFSELRESTGDAFVDELVAAYLEETPAMLAALRAAGAAANAERVCREAHSIKSTSMTLGATGVAAIARAIERGECAPDDAAFSELEAQYQRATTLLKELCGG